MGLDLWFREDVQRILSGLARVGARVGGDYAQGYGDALGDAAEIFGVRLGVDKSAARPQVIVYEAGHYLDQGNRR